MLIVLDSQFEYSLKFRGTKEHANANALSRLPLPEVKREHVLPELVLLTEHLDDSPVTHLWPWSRLNLLLSRTNNYQLLSSTCRRAGLLFVPMMNWDHISQDDLNCHFTMVVSCGDPVSWSLLPIDKLYSPSCMMVTLEWPEWRALLECMYGGRESQLTSRH